MEILSMSRHREPWNNGKLSVEKRRLSLKRFGQLGLVCRSEVEHATCAIRFGDRQQVAVLQPDQAARARYLPRRSDHPTCDHHATKGPTTGPV